MLGQVVIVRCTGAGVHVGTLVEKTDRTVTLQDAHRIWRWRGANTLHELSQAGASTTEYTRISEPVPVIVLADWHEVIPCSEEAAANLRAPRWT